MAWTPIATLAWLRVALGRHSPQVWLLWLLVVVLLALAPVALVDPGLLPFVLDPELAAAVALGALSLVRLPLRRRR